MGAGGGSDRKPTPKRFPVSGSSSWGLLVVTPAAAFPESAVLIQTPPSTSQQRQHPSGNPRPGLQPPWGHATLIPLCRTLCSWRDEGLSHSPPSPSLAPGPNHSQPVHPNWKSRGVDWSWPSRCCGGERGAAQLNSDRKKT